MNDSQNATFVPARPAPGIAARLRNVFNGDPNHPANIPAFAGPPRPAFSQNAPGEGSKEKEGAPGSPGREKGKTREPFVLENGTPAGTEILPDAPENAETDGSAFFVNQTVRPGSFYVDDPRVWEYDGGGYVQDNHPVPASVHAALVGELAARLGTAPHPDDVRLAAHVWLVGALRHADGGEDLPGFVPLPWQVKGRDVPEAGIDSLMFAGVLEMTPHSRASGRCDAFAVSPDFGAVLDAALGTAARGERYVNLLTGRPRRGRKPGSRRYDDHGNPCPLTVSRAMDAVPQGIVNLPAVTAHLDRLRAAVDEATTDEARGRAVARWRNDALCMDWIKSRGLTPTDAPGVYTYPHAWRMQSAGRIMPLESGGAQSLSRAGKVALYTGIADVRNYDLRSSQPRILLDELTRHGIRCAWLAGYLADDNAKHAHATRVGVSVDTWKAALMAAVMGGAAGVPKLFEVKAVTRFVRGVEVTSYRPVCAAMRTLEDEVGAERARELWPVLHAELMPLLCAVKDWHRRLKAWAAETATTGRDGRGVTNAVGARLALSTLSARELPRKVAAHVLQGREALYVHTLCALGEAHGFRIVCHEHDGIVTLGTVPQAAMDEAARVASMPYAELVEKDLAG